MTKMKVAVNTVYILIIFNNQKDDIKLIALKTQLNKQINGNELVSGN